MKKKLFFYLIIFYFINLFAEEDKLSIEQAKIVGFKNKAVKGLVCSFLSAKKIQPIMHLPTFTTFSFDISYINVLSPTYFYDLNFRDFYYFNMEDLVFKEVENKSLNLSVGVRLSSKFVLTGNFSYFPIFNVDNVFQQNIRFDVNCYYNIIKELLFLTGLYAGIGYNYTSGEIGTEKSVFKNINETNFFYTINSKWNYNGINLSLLFNNQLLIFNFWGRIDYFILYGNTETEFNINNINKLEKDIDFLYGLVFSGSMEIAFGWFKLNLEGGRDILSSGMYVNLGIRIGY
ncbi:MAG: hypothetical protein WHS77_09555 [Brevinematales bacterium]